ncbi:MAG: hypothetical protein R2749_00275 [Acidimicrobiales bacterium]
MRRLETDLTDLAACHVATFVERARPPAVNRSTWWPTCRSACRSPPSAAHGPAGERLASHPGLDRHAVPDGGGRERAPRRDPQGHPPPARPGVPRVPSDELITDRRRRGPDGGDDLAILLVHATIDGHSLDDQQLHGYLSLLIGAGNETTRNAITGGVQALLEHFDQAERLAADPDASSVETVSRELLR